MEFKASIDKREMDELIRNAESAIVGVLEECTLVFEDNVEPTIDKPSEHDARRIARDLVHEILDALEIDYY